MDCRDEPGNDKCKRSKELHLMAAFGLGGSVAYDIWLGLKLMVMSFHRSY
jgi:hypothetical protein